jgi:DNA end-binding protein Ku
MLLLGMATRHRRKANGADGASSRGSRSMWSGHVTFGLVSIPVGIHAALEASERVSFRQLHRKDMAPIRYKKFCSEEDVEVPADEIVKGYEVRKGEYAPVEKEELDQVQAEVGEGDRTIEIVQFVDFGSLNPLLFEKPYYLEPQEGGAKAYGVLRAALLETKRVGIARFYLRTRPLLAVLMPGPDVLALEVMRELDELRSPDALHVGQTKPSAGELKMARSLVESMSDTWDPTEHPNTYRKALQKLVASKRTFAVAAREEGAAPAKVVDLMEALRKSLGQERRRGGKTTMTASGAKASGKAATRRRGAA